MVLVPGAAQFPLVHLGSRNCFFYYLYFHHATHITPNQGLIGSGSRWTIYTTSLLHPIGLSSWSQGRPVCYGSDLGHPVIQPCTPALLSAQGPAERCLKYVQVIPCGLLQAYDNQGILAPTSSGPSHCKGAAIYMLTQSHIPHRHVGTHCVPQRILEQWFQELVRPPMTQLYSPFQVYSTRVTFVVVFVYLINKLILMMIHV